MIRYDQLESAWIRNKTSNLSVKGRKTTASDPQNHMIRKHTSKEPHQRRGGAKPLRPPRIMSHALWGYPLIPKNTTRD